MNPKRIAVLGSGRMGEGLGRLWATAGHEVTFTFSRSPDRLTALAVACGPNARADSNPATAARRAEVWLISTWPPALPELFQAVGKEAAGKVLITCSSGLRPDFSGSTIGVPTERVESLAEEIQRLAPGAHVVEAFNVTFAETLAAPTREIGGLQPSVFYCGDEPAAKAVARELAEQAGYHAVDAGPLRVARSLETLATAWVQFAAASGLFPHLALRALTGVTPPGTS